MDSRQPQEGLLRRIAPEASLLLGAGRAILLQLAEPRIGTAVVRHSNFVADPLSRLHNTLAYVYALGAGNERQRERVVNFVDAAHRPVHAPRDPRHGTPAYSARDPRLQAWVAATLYDSATLAARLTLPALEANDEEALYREYAVLGSALQMPEGFWPADRAEFERYFQQMLGQLQVTEEVRQAADELFTGRHAPWWIRAVLPLVRDVTIAQLPPRVRELYGYRLTPTVRRRYGAVVRVLRTANRVLPRAVRHAPMRYSLRRIDKGRLG